MPRKAVLDYATLARTLPDVERWHRHLLARSPDTARINLTNVLRTLHEFRGLQPSALLAMGNEQLDDFMQDYVAFYLDPNRKPRPLAGSTVSKYVDCIKSYLSWHRRELGRPLYIEGANENPVAEAQEIPPQQAVGALLNACDLRTSVMVALEAFSSVRPQVLGRSNASDGLVLGDFPELEIRKEGVAFTKAPTFIRIRKNLSKTKKAYTTLIGPQGCDYIVNYLNSRLAAGEALTKDSPLVTPETKKRPKSSPSRLNPERSSGPAPFMHRGNIQDCIRVRMRKVDIKASTYILRSYFDNRMVVAESHGVSAIYREFWMGHTGGMQTRYALRKEKLPPDSVEDMRRAYSKALPFLETNHSEPSEDPIRRMALAALKAAGHTEGEVAKMDLDGLDESAVVTLMTDAMAKRFTQAASPPAATVNASKPRQKVVAESDLSAMLEDGWVFRATLGGGKAVVEAPT